MVLQNDFKRQWELVQGSAVEAIRRVGASGRYILGPEVESFEAALARFCGMPHAVGLEMGWMHWKSACAAWVWKRVTRS